MKKSFKTATACLLALLIAPVLIFASGDKEKGAKYPPRTMEFIAPAGAGGGWDLTIRTVAKTLQDTKLVSVAMPITNKPGGGGGVNLAYMQTKKGNDNLISVYSPPLILINLNGSSPYSYRNTTPVAGLITDYGAFVVAKNSKYTTIAQVMEDLKKNPASVIIGGTSSAGSMDHIQFLIMARAAGVKELKKIQYVAFQDGTGPAQVLGGHVTLLTTGLGDVRGLLQSGDLRGLAQTGPDRVEADILKDIPTCREQGINEVFRNWRGLFGPPEMPEYAITYWRKALGDMVKTPAWDAACRQNGWSKNYMDAPDFKAFLDKTNEDYKGILAEIGMLKS